MMDRNDPRWAPHAAMSPALREMLADPNMPLTRKNWISMAHGPDVPVPWTAEDEMMVPEPFHDPHFETNTPR